MTRADTSPARTTTAATDAERVTPPRPHPGESRAYAFPRFERRTLPNGLRLVIAPVDKLPIVTLLATIDAGAVTDPQGKEGLAELTAQALREGAASRDGTALTDYAERLGTGIESSADWDAASVRMTVLASRLADALALMADVLMAPTLPEREIERLKGERLAELLQLRAEPRGLADETLDRVVYAREARYAKPAGGTEQSVPGLTRGDVAAFYGMRYHPGAVTIVVAGDVRPADVERLADTVFGRWHGTRQTTIAAPDHAATPGRGIHIVTKLGAPQSELRLGHVGLPRATDDYFPVLLMNAVLGGLFSSRINLNLREAHGYTYGAHSGYEWRRWAGPFAIDAAVARDATSPAVREVLSEIDRIRSEPVTPSELSLATSYLDGVFPIRYETTTAIAAALATLVVHELSPDYYDTYRARVRAVSSDDVLRAARAHLHPDRLQLVVVGDPDAVRAPLEQLAFGPIVVYDDRGGPIA
jgi:zinc protease